MHLNSTQINDNSNKLISGHSVQATKNTRYNNIPPAMDMCTSPVRLPCNLWLALKVWNCLLNLFKCKSTSGESVFIYHCFFFADLPAPLLASWLFLKPWCQIHPVLAQMMVVLIFSEKFEHKWCWLPFLQWAPYMDPHCRL